jgi:DNA invertase Pin-like site-specific DNA recombinase
MGELLNDKGINLVSYDGSIDTNTPTGKMMFQMIGVFSEFNRNLINENVRAGLQKAREA